MVPRPRRDRNAHGAELVPDLTTEVAEIRTCLIGRAWEPEHAFPRMAGYVDVPCEHVLRKASDLIRVHAHEIHAGRARRLAARCVDLQRVSRDAAQHAARLFYRGHYVDGKPDVDMACARDQARWLGWLIADASRAGRKANGCETDLAIDVLGLVGELIEDLPWTRLPRRSLQLRGGLVGWFAGEVKRITALPEQSDCPPHEAVEPTVVTADQLRPSRRTSGRPIGRRVIQYA